jgi:ABC-type Fe3+/spermidine/putrescine transport system ATPase subunit
MLPIRTEGICISRNGHPLFDGFSFDTQGYQRVAIMGSTGAGKTTLLKLMAGFIQPDSGKIYIGDNRVLGPNEQLIAGHPWIGYLSQHYELRNNYYVNELLDMSNKLSQKRMQEVIHLCNIQHLLKRRTDALSGGERQRIALAKILLTDPKWLLLDEPYSNLDLNQKRMIMQLLKDVGEHLGVSMLMVSHDASDMLAWADDLIVIENGKIIQRGNPLSIYHQPVNEYVAGLLGEYNICDASIANSLIQYENFYPADKQFIIRPEYVFISKEEKGVAAEVIELLFKGGYYLVKCRLKANGAIVISAMMTSLLSLGTEIFIYTLSEHVVFI